MQTTEAAAWTPLHQAAQAGEIETLQELLQLQSNKNVDPLELVQLQTPLHIAANAGHNTIVKMLLDAGANVNTGDQLSYTALHLAAQKNHSHVVETLLAQTDIQLNSTDATGATALLCAAYSGHVEAMLHLCQAGASIRQANHSKPTLLHYLLLKEFADSNARLKQFDKLLHTLHTHLAYFMQNCDDEGNNPLHIAILHQPIPMLVNLLQHVNQLDNPAEYFSQANQAGQTPVDLAAATYSFKPSNASAYAASSSAVATPSLLEFTVNAPPSAAIQSGNTLHTTLKVHQWVTSLYKHYQQRTYSQRHSPILNAIQNLAVEQHCTLATNTDRRTTTTQTTDHWLQQPNNPILLVLGESGSGKTLLIHDLERRLWDRHKPKWHFVPAQLSKTEYMQRWDQRSAILFHENQWWLYQLHEGIINEVAVTDLPLYPFAVHLRQHTFFSLLMQPTLYQQVSMGVLSYWICQKRAWLPVPIPLVDHNAQTASTCVTHYLNSILRSSTDGYDESDLTLLLQNTRFLFLFDNFDKNNFNPEFCHEKLYTSNNLRASSTKALFTCNRNYSLGLDQQHLPSSSTSAKASDKIYLMPFNLAEITCYIDQYTKTHSLMKKAAIISVLNQHPDFRAVLSKPLFLYLYLKCCYQDEPQLINRWHLDQKLTQLLHQHQACQHSQNDTDNRTSRVQIAHGYEQLFSTLAFRLFSGEPPLNDEELAHLDRYSSVKNTFNKELDFGYLLIKNPAGGYDFTCPSIKHFFVAKQLLTDLSKAVDSNFRSTLLRWNLKLLPDEPLVLNYLLEAILSQAPEVQTLLYACLRKWVTLKRSKFATCSANAATVLVQVGQGFSCDDLSNTYLAGANLSYGMFNKTNFSGANCKNVNFTQAWLNQANFTQADLSNTRWGENPAVLPEQNYWKHPRKWYSHNQTIYAGPNDEIQVATLGNKVNLWDGRTGQHITTIQAAHWIKSLDYRGDGQQLAIGCTNGTIELWNLYTSKIQTTLKGHTYGASTLSYREDGLQLASISLNTIRLWNLWDASYREITIAKQSSSILHLDYSPDGTQLASGGIDSIVRLWSTGNGELLGTLVGHSWGIFFLQHRKDGQQLASGGGDKTIRLWDLNSKQTQHTLKGHTAYVICFAYCPTRPQLASASQDGTIRLWDVNNGHCQKLLREDTVHCIKYSRSGEQLIILNQKTVRSWPIEDRYDYDPACDSGRSFIFLAYCEATSTLVSSTRYGVLRMWDLNNGRIKNTLSSSCPINCVAFRSDGVQFACGNSDGELQLWSPYHGKLLTTREAHTASIHCLAYQHHGKLLASGSQDSTIKLWDSNGQHISTLEGHTSRVIRLTFRSDGQQLASSSLDHAIKLWDLNGLCAIASLEESTYIYLVSCLSYCNDELLASGHDDGTIRLWDVDKQTVSTILKGHQYAIYDLATQDTSILVSGSRDKTLRFWDIDTHQCLKVLNLCVSGLITALSLQNDTLGLCSTEEIMFWRNIQLSDTERLMWRTGSAPELTCTDLQLTDATVHPNTARLLTQHGAIYSPEMTHNPEASSSTAASSASTTYDPDAELNCSLS
jgi:WD40 repeat protein/ankyrin repeat protein